MQSIIVATDFSDVADNAVHYACKMAEDFKATVTVIHSFIIPVTFSDTPMPVMPVEEGREIAEERMGRLINALSATYPGLTIGSKIMFGEIVDCLEEYLESESASLIVLGNSGSANANLWLGSNALSALKNLQKPVLAVPPHHQYKKPEKICFACDFKNIAGHLQASAIVELMKNLGGQLHVLNVDFEDRHYAADNAFESTDLHMALSSLHPVYHYVEKENVEDGIRLFVEENHMDWLIIVPHRHPFFEGLFHKSHTKAIMKSINIPLVAMHEK
jgi:nucleotide-binding universal stress UspA family protein